MRILILEKEQFFVDAIVTWLEKNESSHYIVSTHCVSKLSDLYQTNQFDAVVMGSSVEPATLKNFFLRLDRPTSFRSTQNTWFITLTSEKAIPIFAEMSKTLSLSIVHLNDAKPFFLNLPLQHKLSGVYFSPSLITSIGKIPSQNHPINTLSRAERHVARLIAQGLTNKKIADRLFISVLTVADHRKHIKEKIGVSGGKNALSIYLSSYTLWLLSDERSKKSQNPHFKTKSGM